MAGFDRMRLNQTGGRILASHVAHPLHGREVGVLVLFAANFCCIQHPLRRVALATLRNRFSRCTSVFSGVCPDHRAMNSPCLSGAGLRFAQPPTGLGVLAFSRRQASDRRQTSAESSGYAPVRGGQLRYLLRNLRNAVGDVRVRARHNFHSHFALGVVSAAFRLPLIATFEEIHFHSL